MLTAMPRAAGDQGSPARRLPAPSTIFEARLSPDHPDTAHSLDDLATVLRA